MATYVVIRMFVLLLLVLPLVAAVLVPLFRQAARRAALLLALVNLGLTAAVVLTGVAGFEERNARLERLDNPSEWQFQPQFVPGDVFGRDGSLGKTSWTLFRLSAEPTSPYASGPNVQLYLGLDGFNIWLVALAAVVLVAVILMSWDGVRERPGAFYGWLFVLHATLLGAFLSFDVILFYVCFELTLIPTFFLIGQWGSGSGRRDAARKFFLYTLAGSLLMLLGIIGAVLTFQNYDGSITFSLPTLMSNAQAMMMTAHTEALAGNPQRLDELQNRQFWIFLAFMAGLVVKVPVWPFHTWLPAAYGEAPTGGAMVLSAVMSKLGTFGILRLVLPLTPDAAITYGLPAVGVLAAVSIVYAAFCAYAAKDVKLVIAYSSVSHLGLLVLGLFAFNKEGLTGAVLHMVNHGLTTGALFGVVGFLALRYRTTEAARFGGLMGRFPVFAVLAFALALASIGLPGFNNFVSEMMILAGLFDARNPGVNGFALPVVAALGIFLSAWYMLTVLRRVFFNEPREPPPAQSEGPADPVTPKDVSRSEWVALGGLTVLCLALGLFPQPIVEPMKADIRILNTVGDAARARAAGIVFVPEEPPAPPTTRSAEPEPNPVPTT